jgi:hypothetical protein
MALGHCGKVSDFVTYCRDVVGTPLAFEGNEATAHGIRTESKARCLYEMIAQQRVSNGGFFPSADGLLGASPDGQVHLRDPTTHQIVTTYLLEIKSPMMALYDASKSAYAPFGIPPAYMCQMQGQMALSNTPWCDFFVFLERPDACCYCIRVFRSNAFWKWAEPKLRLVSLWIRVGLPCIVDRSFDFPTYDFRNIHVEPFIPPFSIAQQCCILRRDPRRFPVFFRCASRNPNDADAIVEIGAESASMVPATAGCPTPYYVSEAMLQQWQGLLALFCPGPQAMEVLELRHAPLVSNESGIPSPTMFLVESVDWDGGVVLGVPETCCVGALLLKARVDNAPGGPVALKFYESRLNGLQHALRRDSPCTNSAHMVAQEEDLERPSLTPHNQCLKRPRTPSGNARSQSTPSTLSQPQTSSQRSLHDAMEALALAVDCRGVVFAASPTAPITCLMNHTPVVHLPPPVGDSTDGDVVVRRESSDAGSHYWALFVEAAELVRYIREVEAVKKMAADEGGSVIYVLDEDDDDIAARSSDYAELLCRVFNCIEQSLVACIVMVDDDRMSSLNAEFSANVVHRICCPFATVSVSAGVGWEGTVELLRRHFQER